MILGSILLTAALSGGAPNLPPCRSIIGQVYDFTKDMQKVDIPKSRDTETSRFIYLQASNGKYYVLSAWALNGEEPDMVDIRLGEVMHVHCANFNGAQFHISLDWISPHFGKGINFNK